MSARFRFRGPHPVGVSTLRDERAARALHLEVWYTAAAHLAGRDEERAHHDRYEVLPGMPTSWQAALRDAPAADTPDPWPLVVFSHGFAGHRRQSSFLCTHLASHGFAVVGVDHRGNTLADLARYRCVERPVVGVSLTVRSGPGERRSRSRSC